MVRLEEIVAGSALTGLNGAEAVEVVAARSYGPDAVEVTFKSASGLSQTIIYRHDESMLAFAQAARRFSFDGDGELLRLASEGVVTLSDLETLRSATCLMKRQPSHTIH